MARLVAQRLLFRLSLASLFLSFLGATSSLWAVSIQARASLSTSEVVVGDVGIVEVEVQASGSTSEPRLRLPDVSGLRLQLQGNTQSFSFSSSGARSVMRRSYQVSIQSSRAGVWSIPGITVTVDGQAIQTNPLNVSFVDPPLNRELTALILTIPFKKAYVGQAVPIKLQWRILETYAQSGQSIRLLSAALPFPRGGGLNLESQKGDATNSFSLEDKKKIWYKEAKEIINGREYYVWTMNFLFVPASQGQLRFPKAVWKMAYQRGFRQYELYAGSDAQALQVVNLPSGAPSSFNGAVGKYTISASVPGTQREVRQLDPVELRIEVHGRPVGQHISLNRFEENSTFADRFRFMGDGFKTQVLPQKISFQRIIRPLHEGPQEIPPITFSFLDPETNQYHKIQTNPITLNVAKARIADLDGLSRGSAHASASSTEKKSRGSLFSQKIGHLSPLENDLSLILGKPSHVLWSFPTLFLALCILLGAGLLGFHLWKYREVDIMEKKRRHQLLSGRQLFLKAAQKPEVDALPMMLKGISLLLQSRSLISGHELSSQDVDRFERDHGLDKSWAQHLRALCAQSDEIRFSGPKNGEYHDDSSAKKIEVKKLFEYIRKWEPHT